MGAGTGSCLPPALTLSVTAPGTTNNKRRINKKMQIKEMKGRREGRDGNMGESSCAGIRCKSSQAKLKASVLLH